MAAAPSEEMGTECKTPNRLDVFEVLLPIAEYREFRSRPCICIDIMYDCPL